MNQALQDKLTAQIIADITALVTEQKAEIFAAYDRAEKVAEEPGTFSIGMSAKIRQDGPHYKVRCAIGFSVSEKYDMESKVDTQPDMFR